jgi:hypothetical protein
MLSQYLRGKKVRQRDWHLEIPLISGNSDRNNIQINLENEE